MKCQDLFSGENDNYNLTFKVLITAAADDILIFFFFFFFLYFLEKLWLYISCELPA